MTNQDQNETSQDHPKPPFKNPFVHNEQLRLASSVFLLMYTFFFVHFIVYRPSFVFYTYPIIYFLLIGWRIYSYYKDDDLLYVLSPCYFVNTFLIIWLIFLPDHYQSQLVLFGLVNGPVYVANFVFKSTIAFDNPDKYTTCFIHIAPVSIAFSLRWYPSLCQLYWRDVVNSKFEFAWFTFYELPETFYIYVIPLICICGHTIVYNLIFHVCANLKASQMDLTRYIVTEHPFFMLFNKKIPRRLVLMIYILIACLYSAATLTLALFAYCSIICNLILLLINICWVVWYTSSYFVKYMPRLNSKTTFVPKEEEILPNDTELKTHGNNSHAEDVEAKLTLSSDNEELN